MAQFGKYFEYNGHSSQEFNLMLASFDEVDEYATGMDREVQRGDMNRYRFKPNHMGMVYNSPLEFEVTFVKDMCNGADLEFTRSEYRKIVDWLTESEYPSLYHMTDYEEDWADEEEDYFGVFSNIQNHAYGEVIGITATFTCDSPFAWSPERIIVFKSEEADEYDPLEDKNAEIAYYLDNADETFVYEDDVAQHIEIDADVEYTYPTIIIQPHEVGEFSIFSTNEERDLTMQMPAIGNTVIMDCENLTITDFIKFNISLSDLGILDPVNIYWPRLLKGDNGLIFSGNATVIFTYREARKVGAY